MSIPFKTERANRRQAALEESLLTLMQEKAYPDITVTDICTHANIPRRTFYHYFNSKEDILDSIVEGLMLSCHLNSMFDFDAGVDAVRQSYLRFFLFWEEKRGILDLLMRHQLETRLILFTSKWLDSDNVFLPFPRHMSPNLLALGRSVASSGFFAVLFHWCRNGFQETPEEMADYVTWFMTHPLFSSK